MKKFIFLFIVMVAGFALADWVWQKSETLTKNAGTVTVSSTNLQNAVQRLLSMQCYWTGPATATGTVSLTLWRSSKPYVVQAQAVSGVTNLYMSGSDVDGIILQKTDYLAVSDSSLTNLTNSIILNWEGSK